MNRNVTLTPQVGHGLPCMSVGMKVCLYKARESDALGSLLFAPQSSVHDIRAHMQASQLGSQVNLFAAPYTKNSHSCVEWSLIGSTVYQV